jgi:dTDP-4-amino-4,6-dideoxygalactose transaminase
MQITLGTFEATDNIRKAVNDVLDSGRLSYGPVSREFEQRFAAMHDCAYGVLTNSGTSSLVVAIQALKELHGWADGDEVIVPALTFVATVNAVLHNRLTPVLVDVDPSTYNIDIAKIEAAITDKTRCIVPVHLFGQPADMWELMWICKHNGLTMVEDSCETMLATWGVDDVSAPVGSWGDIGCFSTYAAHLLVTGVGGICTTHNEDYFKRMRSLVNHGIDLTELPNGDDYDPTFLARKFRFTSIGHSFRTTEIEAAIGLAQLDDLPNMIAKRQQNASTLTQLLQPMAECLQTPVIHPRATHSFMMYPIVLRNGSKWPVMQHLQNAGIETREMVPLTNQPCYNFNEDDYPVAKWVNESGFYVGCHQGLSVDHMRYIAGVLCDYFDKTA